MVRLTPKSDLGILNICPNGNIALIRNTYGRASLAVARWSSSLGACTPGRTGRSPPPRSSSPRWPTATPRRPPNSPTDPDEARAALNEAWAGSAGHRPGRPDPELQVRRGHREHHLPLYLASTQGPDLDLRRSAEHGARRGQLGGPVERHRPAPEAGREPELRAARRRTAARVGQRTRRHRRTGARIPVPLRARRTGGRRRSHAHRPTRSPMRCAASTTPWIRSGWPSWPVRRRDR